MVLQHFILLFSSYTISRKRRFNWILVHIFISEHKPLFYVILTRLGTRRLLGNSFIFFLWIPYGTSYVIKVSRCILYVIQWNQTICSLIHRLLLLYFSISNKILSIDVIIPQIPRIILIKLHLDHFFTFLGRCHPSSFSVLSQLFSILFFLFFLNFVKFPYLVGLFLLHLLLVLITIVFGENIANSPSFE